MRNIALVLAYDGTNYHGWQCQPEVVTVEETLRGAVERVLNHPAKIYGGGRTDAGVHSMGQVANLYTDRTIALDGLVRGVNSLLPRDIRVQGAAEADEAFHARYSATSKTYLYAILNRPCSSPFTARYSWHIPRPLDFRPMSDALRHIAGEHDFAAFKKKDEPYRSTVRKVLRASIGRRGGFLVVVIEATGFLRYMVRNIVGTVALVGAGKMDVQGFADALASGQRERAGPTAPPTGLFLRRIRYPEGVIAGGAGDLTGAGNSPWREA